MRKMYATVNFENFLNVRSMLSVTYLRLTAPIYIVHPCGLIVRKQP